MAVFRVDKTADYTVMSNTHLREREMSLKAKGLLSLMLSLPDNWDYSIEGLVAICKESETAIKSTLGELKKFGYLDITRNRTSAGLFDYVYTVFEKPQVVNPKVDNPPTDNPPTDNPSVENVGQLNTNILNTKKENTKQSNTKNKISCEKEQKHKYGEYNHVLLTDEERERLVKDFGEDVVHDAIKFLDEYIEEKHYKSHSHNLAIRRWVVDAVKKHKPQSSTGNAFLDKWANV